MNRRALAIVFIPAALWGLAGLDRAGAGPSAGPVTLDAPAETIAQQVGQEAEPLWRIPLGPVHVEDMRPVDSDKLLIGLKQNTTGLPNGECVLVDLDAGAVIWRLDRKEKGSYYPVLVQDDMIVFQIEDGDKSSLQVVDATTGVERWKTPARKGVRFFLIPTAGKVLVEARDKKRVDLTALSLSDFTEEWQRQFTLHSNQVPPAGPALWGDMIWFFYDGVERIAIDDGRTLWSRSDLHVGERDAAPQLASTTLYIVHDKALLALDAAGGRTRWSAPLDLSPTNIYPDGENVYVRGELPFSDPAGRFSFMRPTDWPLVWERLGQIYRFQDNSSGAFILVAYHQPRAQLEEIFPTMLEGLRAISDGRPHRRSQVDTTLGGQPARWTRYSFDMKPEDGEKRPWVAYVGAVVSKQSGAGVSFLGVVPEDQHESVKGSIEQAFRTTELAQGRSVAESWRQRSATKGAGSYQISAFSVDDGSARWRYRSEEPTISNFVTVGGRLYVATPTSLIALQKSQGREAFVVQVTETPRPYPVRLRAHEENVVFIGELVIAAYHITSGDEIYRHGITPIFQEASLAGLDNSMPQFEQMLAGVRGVRPAETWAGGMARASYARYQQYQYYSLAYGGSHARFQTGMSRSLADWQLTMSIFYMSMEISNQLRLAFLLRGWQRHYEDILARQQLFRNSILSAYGLAETGDYVYRPHRRATTTESAGFMSVTLIHLPSGRRRTTTLSPAKGSYGLWNYVDLDKGVVYHHGPGLDPTFYEQGRQQAAGMRGSGSTTNTFLIAAPVTVPE